MALAAGISQENLQNTGGYRQNRSQQAGTGTA
jgi:hypothetical protein